MGRRLIILSVARDGDDARWVDKLGEDLIDRHATRDDAFIASRLEDKTSLVDERLTLGKSAGLLIA